MVWLLVLLLPLTLFGQITFEPMQLDDGLGEEFLFTSIFVQPDGKLLCTWCSKESGGYTSYGQLVSSIGELVGSPICYEENAECAPRLTAIRRSDGREGQLLGHS